MSIKDKMNEILIDKPGMLSLPENDVLARFIIKDHVKYESIASSWKTSYHGIWSRITAGLLIREYSNRLSEAGGPDRVTVNDEVVRELFNTLCDADHTHAGSVGLDISRKLYKADIFGVLP